MSCMPLAEDHRRRHQGRRARRIGGAQPRGQVRNVGRPSDPRRARQNQARTLGSEAVAERRSAVSRADISRRASSTAASSRAAPAVNLARATRSAAAAARTTFLCGPHFNSSSPRSRARSMMRCASSASGALVAGSATSSIASIAPRPRTSPICRHARLQASKRAADLIADRRRPRRPALPSRRRRAPPAPTRRRAGCRRRCRRGRPAAARP